jgi:hypothetical protein
MLAGQLSRQVFNCPPKDRSQPCCTHLLGLL